MDKEKQQRDTRQRREVLDEVKARCDHPTADQIYSSVREKDPTISKGTVYRNLNTLSDMSSITHVRVTGSDRFDSRLDNHYHIICSICGKVIDAPVDYIPEYDKTVEEKTGFRISRHRTLFEGICPDCLKKSST